MTMEKLSSRDLNAIPPINDSLTRANENRERLDNLYSIESIKDAKRYLQLLHEFRTFDREAYKLHGSDFGKQIKKLLSVGDDGLYTDPLRFLFELIQNVDDCDYESSDNCELKIDFDNAKDTIVLEYNEKGFTTKNVFALTGIWDSSKNKEDLGRAINIGEKGIGFKSVFGVAEKVWIQSGFFSFEIYTDQVTIPIARYSEFEGIKGTKVTLYLAKEKASQVFNEVMQRYADWTSMFTENPILFLNKLTKITYYLDRENQLTFGISSRCGLENSLSVEDNLYLDFYKIKRGKVSKKHLSCFRYVQPVHYDARMCYERYENPDITERYHQLIAIVPKPNQGVQKGALYSFLPTKIETTVPIAIHAPFKLSASREKIDSQHCNEWYIQTIRALRNFIKYLYIDLAHHVNGNILSYIPSTGKKTLFYSNDPSQQKLLLSNAWSLNKIREAEVTASIWGTTISDYPIIITVFNDFVSLKDVCCVQDTSFEDAHKIIEFLPHSKPLFAGDYRANIEEYGIDVIKDVYNKLVKDALIRADHTRQILGYLRTISQKKIEDNLTISFPENGKVSMSQILLFKTHPLIWNKFSEMVWKSFKEKNSRRLIVTDVPVGNKDKKNVEIFKDVLHGYSRSLNKSISEYMERCTLVKVNGWKAGDYFAGKEIFLYGELLNDIGDLYQRVSEKGNRHFYALLQLESISQQFDELIRSEPDLSEEEFLERLYDNNLLQKKKLGSYYQKILKFIDESGTDTYRFMNELLQNADDCIYAENVIPTYKLSLSNNALTVDYNEKGFSKENVRALTDIGESTKKYVIDNQQNFTGEKGIGFKAIFKVCNSVDIHSGRFHFALNEKEPTIPYRIDSDFSKAGTSMVFRLKQGLSSNLWDYKNILRLILCLRKLRKFSFNHHEVKFVENNITRTLTYDDKTFEFFKFEYTYLTAEDTLEYRHKENQSIRQDQVITYLVPEDQYKLDYFLYNGLPTLLKMNIPLVIDAPFALTTSREDIPANIWNKEVSSKVYIGYVHLLMNLKIRLQEKIFELVPDDGKLFPGIAIGQHIDLISVLKKQKLFKKVGSDSWFSLSEIKDPYLPYPIEKYLWVQYGDKTGKNVSDSALNYSLTSKYSNKLRLFGIQKASYGATLERVLFSTFNAITPANLLADKKLRELFYSFLTDNANRGMQSERLTELQIVPVISEEGGLEFRTAHNIYCAPRGTDAVSDSAFGILDEKLLSKEDYNRVFSSYLEVFSERKRLDLYAERIRKWIQIEDLEQRFSILFVEYTKYPGLFKGALEYLSIYDIQEIPVRMRDGSLDISEFRYVCDYKLNHFTDCLVSSDSDIQSFAACIDIPKFEEICGADEFPYENVSDEQLCEMFSVGFSNPNDIYVDLIDNDIISYDQFQKYFWKLCRVASLTYAQLSGWKNKFDRILINIGDNPDYCFISLLSCRIDYIGFQFDEPPLLKPFDRDEIIDEVWEDIFRKIKSPEQQKNLEQWLDLKNIYYSNVMLPVSAVLWRDNNLNKRILLDINRRLDIEIIQELSDLLETYWGLKITLDRHMHFYSRRGMRYITSVPYGYADVLEVVQNVRPELERMRNQNNREEEKNFLTSPIRSRGKIFGGYAKHCPLCGARVHTELTGFRIVKISQAGTVNNKEIFDNFHLICCQNCHDAFRYSEGNYVDLAKWHKYGILSITVLISGERWHPKEFLPKLAHQALLYEMNAENFDKAGCDWESTLGK